MVECCEKKRVAAFPPKKKTIEDVLRKCIDSSSKSVNQIQVEAGLGESSNLHRFVNGQRTNMRLSTAEKLFNYFGLIVVFENGLKIDDALRYEQEKKKEMRIIKPGPKYEEWTVKRLKCSRCYTEIEVDRSDCQEKKTKNANSNKYLYVICPKCSTEIYVQSLI